MKKLILALNKKNHSICSTKVIYRYWHIPLLNNSIPCKIVKSDKILYNIYMCICDIHICMCIHTYIHTPCMHHIHSLHTHKHTQRNKKQYLENGVSLIWAIRRGKKWNIVIILPESEEITNCWPNVNTGNCWTQLVSESWTSEEVNILSSVGSLMSPSEIFGLIFLPISWAQAKISDTIYYTNNTWSQQFHTVYFASPIGDFC